MTKNTRDWLLVLALPLLIIGSIFSIVSGSLAGLLLGLWLIIGGLVGVFAGFSDAPIYTTNFKLLLALALAIAVSIVSFAFRYRERLLGKVLITVGIYLWCFTGLIALGMSS